MRLALSPNQKLIPILVMLAFLALPTAAAEATVFRTVEPGGGGDGCDGKGNFILFTAAQCGDYYCVNSYFIGGEEGYLFSQCTRTRF